MTPQRRRLEAPEHKDGRMQTVFITGSGPLTPCVADLAAFKATLLAGRLSAGAERIALPCSETLNVQNTVLTAWCAA